MNRKSLLKLSLGPKTPYPRNQSVVQVFEEIVEKYPKQIALKCKQQTLSYRDLNSQANQLARYLQKIGVKHQECVGIYLERSIDLFVAILAILKIGAVYVPIDASYPAKRKRLMIEDLHLKFLISEPSFKSQFKEMPLKLLFLPQLSLPKEKGNLQCKIHPLDIAYVSYTSGTTGVPKGVEIPHRGINRLVKNTHWIKIVPEDRFLQISNLSFDPMTQELWGALLNGATLCIYPESHFSPDDLGAFIVKEKITQLVFTSRVFTLMVEEALESFKNVRYICVGGDVLSEKHAKQVIETFPSVHVLNEYGPVENTTGSTIYEVSFNHPKGSPLPIGRPMSNSSAYVLDEKGDLAPFGKEGELYVGGDGLARGYLHRPEITAQKFIPNPFGKGVLYRTGDLARYLPDGNLLFLGRIDTQVKIRGFRIELGEITEAFRKYPKVTDCAVRVIEQKEGNKQIVAYLETEEKISDHKLHAWGASHLPIYMVPHMFIKIKKMPSTPNGKIDLHALPLPMQGRIEQKICKTGTEKTVQNLWAQLLNFSSIGRKENFFSLGGDSILAMQLSALARETFQIAIPVNLIFQEPSLEKYAEQIDLLLHKKKGPSPLKKPFSEWREQEARLPSKIHGKNGMAAKARQYTHPKKIFLTGSTGLVGPFFLRELLEETKAHVYCLIREGSEEKALERLISTCQTYLIWKPQYRKRIKIVLGSLDLPYFGLKPKEFQGLAEEIDSIFHIGAFVNHAMPYARHQGANVFGTKEVLRLSATCRLKPLHFISSLSVLEGVEKTSISEETDIEESRTLSNGYAESKWVAEKLIFIARSRGIPCNIFRLPRVGGDSLGGAGPVEDFLWRLVHAAIYLQKAPQLDLFDDLTPVDYICKAIHAVSKDPKWINSQFHVMNPHKLFYADLFKYLQKLGYPLALTDFQTWQQELHQAAKQTEEKNIQALSLLFSVTSSVSSPHPRLFTSSHLQKALRGSGIRCPKITFKLFKKWVDYYVKRGFLPKSHPKHRKSFHI